MRAGGRQEGARERAVVHSAAATAPALAAAVAPAHRTPSCPSLLAGQRMYDGGGCDADISEIPRFKRRPVRVGGATGRPWGAIAHRERAGRVRVVDSTH